MTGTDHELLAIYAGEGSDAAFAELVRRHAGAVQAAALRQTRNPQLAEEVMQAVFIQLGRKAGSLKSQSVLLGWLLRSTRYAAIDAIRSEARRQQRHALFAKMPTMNADSAGGCEDGLWDRVAPVLDEALDRLRAPDREALLLRFFGRNSLNQVGAALGIAEDAARKRVTRALDRLREELQRLGVTTSSSALPALLLREAAPGTSAAVLAAAHAAGQKAAALADGLGRRALRQQVLGWAGGLVLIGVLAGGGWATWTGLRSSPQVAEMAPHSDYRSAGFPDAAVVHQALRELQAAVRLDDRAAVARRVRFPLRVNRAAGPQWVANETEFIALYDPLFPSPVRGALLQAPDHGLFCNQLGVMIGSGSIWLGPVGDPARPEPRIIALNLLCAVRQKYLLPDDLIRCAKKVLPGLPSVRVGGAELGSAAKQPSQA